MQIKLGQRHIYHWVTTYFKLNFVIIWELTISIVAVLEVEFLPILGVYKT